jgi:hypothetical protein
MKTMINKRYLFKLGEGAAKIDDPSLKQDKEHLSMGEDEQWEALSKEGIAHKTWWRKFRKMN